MKNFIKSIFTILSISVLFYSCDSPAGLSVDSIQDTQDTIDEYDVIYYLELREKTIFGNEGHAQMVVNIAKNEAGNAWLVHEATFYEDLKIINRENHTAANILVQLHSMLAGMNAENENKYSGINFFKSDYSYANCLNGIALDNEGELIYMLCCGENSKEDFDTWYNYNSYRLEKQ